jgi:hypothetical protein
MKKKANPGEIARARRERGRVVDTLGEDVKIIGGVGLIHLGGAVGLRISVAPGQKELAEKILQAGGIQVPYTVREMTTPHKQED